ncbi:YjaG family protein [Aliivibrio kagoshimensis]|uniref:YjaG family protein n=1 Tax=Aliivibrio kagoshimensis TaxID=2910230 RepID=UPI003D13D0A8
MLIQNQELQNPLQVRLEKFEPWQQITFMACLCERMYPNYALFCEETEFSEHQTYRVILDSIWEILIVKGAKINFERQLEKLEALIPTADDESIYLTYPAIDACFSLSTMLHGLLDRDELQSAMFEISQKSVSTVVQLIEAQSGEVINNDNQKESEPVCEEWDVQWAIFRALKECEARNVELIKSLRTEIRDDLVSNIGVELNYSR